MPTSANGKYAPPYWASAGICSPGMSLEKKKNVRLESRIPASDTRKLKRYDAVWTKSRTTKAQSLRSVIMLGVFRDDLREDLGEARLAPRAFEDADAARDRELDDRGNRL